MNYSHVIDKICSEKDIELTKDQIDELLLQLSIINEYVQIANDSLNHKLNSTQVVSYIIYDFLKQRGLTR